jgi:beta-phosphoglucomutase-like phosphatase (HAD superfamily)
LPQTVSLQYQGRETGNERPKAIIFDLDGTILDISERDTFACYESLKTLGYNVPLDEVKRHYRYGMGLTGILRELEINLTEKETEDFLNTRFISFTNIKNAGDFTRIHRGARDVLALLSQKY